MVQVLVRLIATASALLVIPLALFNWVRFESDVYVSGRTSDVVWSQGDGYAIAALAAIVLLARVARTVSPRLGVLFPWVCIACGLGITLMGGLVLVNHWSGQRLVTVYAQFVLGITIAVCGALMMDHRSQSAPPERDDEEGGLRIDNGKH